MMHAVRSLLLAALALLQIAAAFTPGVFGLEADIGEVASRYDSPLIPAGWAFSIWTLLYAGGLYLAVWHAVRPDDPVATRVGWLAILAFAGNTAFALHQPNLGPGFGSFAILQFIFVTSYLGAKISGADPAPDRWDDLASMALFALAGWVLVASPAGFSTALVFTDLVTFEGPETPESLIILFAWAPFALAFTYGARAWAFALPIVWGLFAVGMANLEVARFAIGVFALSTAFLGVTAMAKARTT